MNIGGIANVHLSEATRLFKQSTMGASTIVQNQQVPPQMMIMQQALAMQQFQFQQALLMQQVMASQQAAARAATVKTAQEMAAARAAEISKQLKGNEPEVEEENKCRQRDRSASLSPIRYRRDSRPSPSPVSRERFGYRGRSTRQSYNYRGRGEYTLYRRDHRSCRSSGSRSRSRSTRRSRTPSRSRSPYRARSTRRRRSTSLQPSRPTSPSLRSHTHSPVLLSHTNPINDQLASHPSQPDQIDTKPAGAFRIKPRLYAKLQESDRTDDDEEVDDWRDDIKANELEKLKRKESKRNKEESELKALQADGPIEILHLGTETIACNDLRASPPMLAKDALAVSVEQNRDGDEEVESEGDSDDLVFEGPMLPPEEDEEEANGYESVEVMGPKEEEGGVEVMGPKEESESVEVMGPKEESESVEVMGPKEAVEEEEGVIVFRRKDREKEIWRGRKHKLRLKFVYKKGKVLKKKSRSRKRSKSKSDHDKGKRKHERKYWQNRVIEEDDEKIDGFGIKDKEEHCHHRSNKHCSSKDHKLSRNKNNKCKKKLKRKTLLECQDEELLIVEAEEALLETWSIEETKL